MSFHPMFAIAAAVASVVFLGHDPSLAAPQSRDEAPVVASPSQVVAEVPAGHWVSISPENLLFIELAKNNSAEQPPVAATVPTAKASGTAVIGQSSDRSTSLDTKRPAGLALVETAPAAAAPRRIVIQLITPPYSQGWVSNVRLLAAQHWWDGLAITRVQDNYVVQWGDPKASDPDRARALPAGLQKMPTADFLAGKRGDCGRFSDVCPPASLSYFTSEDIRDPYAHVAAFADGWPVALEGARTWPIHCYGTVGVGRDNSPDTGTGAELYAVIGHAPRHLDRNIGIVGRVIEGIEHLASLPRGTAALGFYATPEEHTTIQSIRLGSEVPELPTYEYLGSGTETFARYVRARANRQDDFFIQPAGAVDVCNVPVPIRKVSVPTANKKKRAGN